MSHVKFHNWNFTCWNVSHVKFHMWEFTCGISHVKNMSYEYFTCEISHVKFHMWNFTCEISHVKFHMWNFTCEEYVTWETHGFWDSHVLLELHMWITCESHGKHIKIFCKGYTKRHNDILSFLVQWINKQNMQNSNLYSDLDDIENNRIVEVFQPNVHPDLVIIQNHSVYVLELTVCHETNLEKSCKFKTENYKNLTHFLQPKLNPFRYIFSLSKYQYTVSWQSTSRLSLPEFNYTISLYICELN